MARMTGGSLAHAEARALGSRRGVAFARAPWSALGSLAVGACALAACAQGSSVGVASGGGGAGGDLGGASHGGGGHGASTGAAGGGASGGAGATGGVGAGGAAGGGGDAGGGSGGKAPFVASSCAPGTFAVGLDDLTGALVCSTLDAAALDAINAGCRVYLGWRDSCTGCNTAPSKWGHASYGGCTNGVGVDSTCQAPLLDGQNVHLFGVDMDGDVNDDDKFYVGLYCDEGEPAPSPGPCPPGWFATGLEGASLVCSQAEVAVLGAVRDECELYFGWRDGCDDCTSAPDRWGRVGSTGCTVGAGATATCTTPSLGGTNVPMLGLNTGGDVDGNDKFYVALRCAEPAPVMGPATGSCPPGQLVVSLAADGTLGCESPAPLVDTLFEDHCSLYFGWRDSCGSCTSAPSKWGRVRDGFCTNDLGVDNTCAQTVLGGETLQMFGLSTDGDVGGDDKLYVGFRCE